VLWDLDGTLMDTEPLWLSAELDLAAEHGAGWERADAIAKVGTPLAATAVALRERGVRLEVPVIMRRLAAAVAASVARQIPWQPGAQVLVEQLAALQVPMALVTSSPGVLAAVAAREVGAFAVVVSGDDVTDLKPDPGPYLLAAGRLGVPPAACLVLEDSPSGIAAGLASGARVLAIESMLPVEDRPGLSVATTLEGMTVHDLVRIVDGERLVRRAGGDRGSGREWGR
jgi:HAD superfamily hydrolase (TIGR01509 family)